MDKPVNGYDFARRVLDWDPDGGVETLLKCTTCIPEAGGKGSEVDWLEKKATVYRSEKYDSKYRDKLKKLTENHFAGKALETETKYLQNELLTNIAYAIVALHNSRGGVLLIGIDDKTSDPVSFEDNDGDGILKKKGSDAFLREAVLARLCPKGGVFKFKDKTITIPVEKVRVVAKWYKYKGKPVLALLVPSRAPESPSGPLWVTTTENNIPQREVPLRAAGDLGMDLPLDNWSDHPSPNVLQTFREEREQLFLERYDLTTKLKNLKLPVSSSDKNKRLPFAPLFLSFAFLSVIVILIFRLFDRGHAGSARSSDRKNLPYAESVRVTEFDSHEENLEPSFPEAGGKPSSDTGEGYRRDDVEITPQGTLVAEAVSLDDLHEFSPSMQQRVRALLPIENPLDVVGLSPGYNEGRRQQAEFYGREIRQTYEKSLSQLYERHLAGESLDREDVEGIGMPWGEWSAWVARKDRERGEDDHAVEWDDEDRFIARRDAASQLRTFANWLAEGTNGLVRPVVDANGVVRIRDGEIVSTADILAMAGSKKVLLDGGELLFSRRRDELARFYDEATNVASRAEQGIANDDEVRDHPAERMAKRLSNDDNLPFVLPIEIGPSGGWITRKRFVLPVHGPVESVVTSKISVSSDGAGQAVATGIRFSASEFNVFTNLLGSYSIWTTSVPEAKNARLLHRHGSYGRDPNDAQSVLFPLGPVSAIMSPSERRNGQESHHRRRFLTGLRRQLKSMVSESIDGTPDNAGDIVVSRLKTLLSGDIPDDGSAKRIVLRGGSVVFGPSRLEIQTLLEKLDAVLGKTETDIPPDRELFPPPARIRKLSLPVLVEKNGGNIKNEPLFTEEAWLLSPVSNTIGERPQLSISGGVLVDPRSFSRKINVFGISNEPIHQAEQGDSLLWLCDFSGPFPRRLTPDEVRSLPQPTAPSPVVTTPQPTASKSAEWNDEDRFVARRELKERLLRWKEELSKMCTTPDELAPDAKGIATLTTGKTFLLRDIESSGISKLVLAGGTILVQQPTVQAILEARTRCDAALEDIEKNRVPDDTLREPDQFVAKQRNVLHDGQGDESHSPCLSVPVEVWPEGGVLDALSNGLDVQGAFVPGQNGAGEVLIRGIAGFREDALSPDVPLKGAYFIRDARGGYVHQHLFFSNAYRSNPEQSRKKAYKTALLAKPDANGEIVVGLGRTLILSEVPTDGTVKRVVLRGGTLAFLPPRHNPDAAIEILTFDVPLLVGKEGGEIGACRQYATRPSWGVREARLRSPVENEYGERPTVVVAGDVLLDVERFSSKVRVETFHTKAQESAKATRVFAGLGSPNTGGQRAWEDPGDGDYRFCDFSGPFPSSSDRKH